jgi:hypothetical protein
MEFNTILLLTALLGVIWLFLFGLKRILDAETYKSITNKIVAYIVKAEIDIQGISKGNERLNEVVHNLIATSDERERKLLRRINVQKLVTNVFNGVVVPILFRRGIR